MKKAIAILLLLATMITAGAGITTYAAAGDEYLEDVQELLPNFPN